MIFAAALLAAALQAAPATAPTPPAKPAAPAKDAPTPAGLDASAMDPAADPCQDFFRYACGGWIAKTEIPADRPRFSRGFLSIQDRNEDVLHQVLDELAAGKGVQQTASGQKLADYYASCVDEAGLEKSLPALQAELKPIQSIGSAKEVMAQVARLHRDGITPLFSFSSTQDFKDATRVIGQVDQAGLGLPDRDYYLKDDAKTQAVREAYRAWATTAFGLLGQSPKQAEKSAAAVLSVETALAKAALSRVERRDPKNLYHRLERDGLKKTAPGIAWDSYFEAAGAKGVSELNVTHPPYFAALDSELRTRKPDAWRAYLSFAVVRSVVESLPKAFREAHFRFESKALTGADKELPRWKRCVSATDHALGEALAQPFVAKTFGADGKQITSEMVAEIEHAFERDVDSVSWMDAETKARALEKARKIYNKIGFPDRWRNYDAVKVDRASFLENMLQTGAFEQARQLAKIGKPLDRTEWLMTPPTVNAYYEPPMNEIVFPAGILQPPFYNREATYAVNFGAMGMVVGHETTHGFDDEGREFDGEGNLHQWWTDTSDKGFTERAACAERQYGNEVAIDEIKLNGKLTLGENVADMGGIKLAFSAMKAYAAKKPALAPSRFTPEQQFFLGFAQSWCDKRRPEFARVRAATDPHSPSNLRVNVPLRNFPEFAKAFGCAEGTPMALRAADRCEVW